MTLILVVVQSHFIINNIFEGLFWLVLPVSLVICNDIMAYVFGTIPCTNKLGFFFGRTPLISLSPKKTWEGFVGAFVSTIVFGYFFSGFLGTFPYLVCPPERLGASYFSGTTCQVNPVFTPQQHPVTPAMSALIRHLTGRNIAFVEVLPVQLHALIMATFASLIAPFGGFFASGVKRAFKIKDFGDSIPGHGGLTDR
jgi:phosphatidate cytidylyltransferase